MIQIEELNTMYAWSPLLGEPGSTELRRVIDEAKMWRRKCKRLEREIEDRKKRNMKSAASFGLI